MRLDQSPLHQQLQQHHRDILPLHMRDMFTADPERAERFFLNAPHIQLDYSKNRITKHTIELLLKLADHGSLEQGISALFNGASLNNTENRPALHTALRASEDTQVRVDGVDIMPEIQATKSRMGALVDAVHKGSIKGFTGRTIDTLVSIGIGGSFLGPKMVVEALRPFQIPGFNCHFVANIDGNDLHDCLSKVDHETTLFLIQSKSFTTLETLENAKAARAWQLEHGMPEADLGKHWLAVSTNLEAAHDFGIEEKNVFPMWDWVGGRYSLWSAIGLPIAFSVGMARFEQLLCGARAMDEHFRSAPLSQNMPVIMALLGVWYGNYFGSQSHAVLPYDQHLQHFPEHLQQLDMESNGKSVDRDGAALTYMSGPVIWGGPGSNGQHAYHQLLHQGTQMIPADFIMPLSSHHNLDTHHHYLFTNCLSQSQAMMQGKTYEEALRELQTSNLSNSEAARLAPHKVIAGNKPSNTLLLEQLTPESLGALIALYEHKVFVQGHLWHINSFDQWGVELGKSLSNQLMSVLKGKQDDSWLDSSTRQLLTRYQLKKSGK